jgi:hypothetical protein
MALASWLVVGFLGFFAVRAALFAGDRECHPITIGTLVASLFLMWGGPLLWFVALIFFGCYLCDGHSGGGPVKRFFQTPIANPCEWWRNR